MKYVAFLRGINVGGHRKIKMAEFREILEQNGFSNVSSYIQSGNIYLETNKRAATISSTIKAIIENNYGYNVPSLTIQQSQCEEILDSSPYKDEQETKKLYYCLLDDVPTNEGISSLSSQDYQGDEWSIIDKTLYIRYREKISSSKFDLKQIEKHLKVTGTVRNHNTMVKMSNF